MEDYFGIFIENINLYLHKTIYNIVIIEHWFKLVIMYTNALIIDMLC